MVTQNPAPQHVMPLRFAHLLLVFVGGVLGVLARELLLLAFAVNTVGEDPAAWSVLVANLVGSFLLAVLFVLLASGDEDAHLRTRRDRTRLLVGTGVLGGFTTYSALAQIVSMLLLNGDVVQACLYGVGTVFVAAVMTWFGLVVGRAIRPDGDRASKPGVRASKTDGDR